MAVPRIIYANDPNWISPLEHDVMAVFDPEENPVCRQGAVCRWVLKNGSGALIGRVAAFVNPNTAHAGKQPTGGMGFFECIHNHNAAFLLFDACKEWLKSKGMKAMDGPVNFGEKERFWGLLTGGFGKSTPYLLNYNPPYYQELFEAYGFKNYYDQFVYHAEASNPLPPILQKKHDRLTESQGYRFEHIRTSRLDQYAEDFATIYNKAWSKAHTHFRPMNKGQAIKMFRKMKNVIDEELIIFGYHHETPIAFFIGLPELNQLFRYVNGRLSIRGKLLFLYHRWRGRCRTIYGLVFGVIPEYHNRGIESALIIALKNIVGRRNHYKDIYITWIGDFNPKMIRIVEFSGAKKTFTLTTYRKLFNPDLVFERHPVVDQ